jgi:hypothetical protein
MIVRGASARNGGGRRLPRCRRRHDNEWIAFSLDASPFSRTLVARRRQYCGTTGGFEGQRNLSESANTKYAPSNTLLGLYPSLMNQWNLTAVSNPSKQGRKVFPMMTAKQQSAWEKHSKEMNKSSVQASVLVILCMKGSREWIDFEIY